MTRRVFSAAVAAAAAAGAQQARPMMRLQSSEASVAFDLLGGGLVEFQLAGSGSVNPLTWEQAGGALEARPRGHFLCLDRWGQPSKAEEKNGMPFHGEASHVEWKQQGGAGRMEAMLPMAQIHVERTAALQGAVLTVRERVTNRAKLGRMFNMVQHPSIAPPFLDVDTVVDANCGGGFAQSAPDGFFDFQSARKLTANAEPNVTSFPVHAEIGWVTALSPRHNLLIGYLWESAHYPWLNLWRHVQDGRPAARGLEFGTTGLHQPYPELARRGPMRDKPLFAYLDAGETQERSYRAFLRKAPAGATAVQSLRMKIHGEIEVKFTV